ncbi:hypothetical protein PGT21_016043 [Puccinia graminis f. sp. tritici]|uniref:Uncharacterized protein n=1 Tax=Puccinia graminis f. sp. tritici TaxID=56615 RepID=A0A5B0MKR1_PUCGR|nr:hypothetical protein PGT21_016043 [Puccinia graminis f. sp. tritici]
MLELGAAITITIDTRMLREPSFVLLQVIQVAPALLLNVGILLSLVYISQHSSYLCFEPLGSLLLPTLTFSH